jgi:hypothetical protein
LKPLGVKFLTWFAKVVLQVALNVALGNPIEIVQLFSVKREVKLRRLLFVLAQQVKPRALAVTIMTTLGEKKSRPIKPVKWTRKIIRGSHSIDSNSATDHIPFEFRVKDKHTSTYIYINKMNT